MHSYTTAPYVDLPHHNGVLQMHRLVPNVNIRFTVKQASWPKSPSRTNTILGQR
jgi:hypothetical protein